MKPQYLIRMDDIHPQMNHTRFKRFTALLDKYNIKPILGVIPKNVDDTLIHDDEDKEFFAHMRELQARGYYISMHGYEHHYTTTSSGIMGVNPYSEFASILPMVQKEKIREGVRIMKENGLNSSMFMAPAHSFDRCTMKILKENGVDFITDGFFLFPKKIDNIWFLPHQFWSFREVHLSGIFTFGLHIDTIVDFEKFMRDSEKFFINNKEYFIEVKDINFEKYDTFGYQCLNTLFYSLYKLSFLIKHKKLFHQK